MVIKERLAHQSNYTTGRHETIKYIVVHYTANNGDTAAGNCNYFSQGGRKASAHYFVDEKEVYRSVRDINEAWHCGADKYNHKYCRNANSLGVEMCSDKVNGQYVITENTVKNTVELVKELMKKYNVPTENVLRHYDVTGKLCPEPWVRNKALWTEFKERLEAEDYYMVQKIEIELNGEIRTVEAINKEGFNYVKMRDLADDKISVGYDSKRALPVVKVK